MKPVRVLMTIACYHPWIGGGEKQLERLARVLESRGHEVTILTRRYEPGLPATELVHGVRVVRVGGANRWAYLLGALRWIASHRRSVDVIHAHSSYSPLVIGVIAARLWGIPVVCKPLQPVEVGWVSGQGIVPYRRRWLYRKTSRWIAQSEEIAHVLEPFAPGRVRAIPNGVDTDAFAPVESDPARLSTVVYVGRLEQPKRVDLVLQAWKELEVPARLVVVGDGSMRRQWEEYARQEGLREVQFLGARSDVREVLREADLCVLPSDWEGCSNALLEAMSCGLPCIASGVGALPDMLTGVGTVVPPGSVQAWTEALNALLRAPERRSELGRAARARVLERYSIAQVASLVEGVYAEVLGYGGGDGR